MRKQRHRFVEWKNSSCVLRFKTAQPTGEPLNLNLIERIREPISRSKMTVRGKVPGAEPGNMRHCESHNEVRAVVVLNACAHADILKMQPFEMSYEFEGKKRKYYPDVLLAWGSELCAVEIKEDKKAEEAAEKARFQAIEQHLRLFGIHFRVWKKSEFFAEPRFSTSRSIIRYQRCPVTPFDRELLRNKFAENPVIGLGELDDNDIRTALSLVINGELFIDWESKLTKMSWVSISPIGEQLWPANHTVA